MIRLMAVVELEGQAPRALTHESNAKSFTMGRDGSADFQIPLTTVSRVHARISETDNVYMLEDLGSTHGTLLNGKKIPKGEKQVLRDGDVIELTKARITCSIAIDKVADMDAVEGTQAIALKAMEGILGRMGDPASDGPFFRVLNGADEGARLALAGTHSEWAMGRSKDCELVLNDPNVSRRHAIVQKDWNGFTIQDLGSKNGVIVNERKIEKPRRLKHQDMLVIGPIKLVYIDPDAELMASLADVPGFEPEVEEPEVMEEMPSVAGAPEEQEYSEGFDEEGHGDEGEGAEAEEEEFEDIDPELLADTPSKFPIEWVVGAVAGLFVLACIVVLIALLGPA